MSTYVLKNSEQTGPFEDADIQAGLASGGFSYDDHAWREGMAEWQPLSTLYPPPPSTPRFPPAPALAANRQFALICQTCGQGALVKRKKYRMSAPVVIIGYILLIPCVIGMLFDVVLGVVLLFTSGLAGTEWPAAVGKETRTRLEAQAIPEPIIQKVVASKPITADDLSALTPEQKSVVDEATRTLSAAKVGAGAAAIIGGGLSIFLVIFGGIFCFVGGLLGWLLVMKKKILQCNQCSAVVAAS